jgi:nanoRNase/pAp phosphatase (c-di-AMP/oligoRNAs hydrolase)
MVIENAQGTEFIPRIIPLLTEMPLAEVLAQPFVAERVAALMARHLDSMELIRERAELKDGVIYIDLLDLDTEAVSKFIPYYYYPDATYTVVVGRSSFRTKISVGTNPWTKVRVSELVNLAEICERFGGGGHARVGAISFGAQEVDRAREVAEGIVRELRGA